MTVETPPTPQPPPVPAPPSQPYRHEKDEKQEKDEEKRTEKEEKSREEKWRRDPLGAIIWACILIWAGIVFLIENFGLLGVFEDQPGFFGRLFGGLETWSLILFGAGVILLVEAFVRTTVPEYRRPVNGTIILGVIFIGVGLGDSIGWGLIWPFALIVIGVLILVQGFVRRR
jgi:hypothetical protein